MARPVSQLPQGEDTVLNMTPMIDICFQLVVFFMLTLEFKSIDRRFETQLPKVGQQPTPGEPLAVQHVTVRLFRKNLERPVGEHFTRVRVGERLTVDLPPGPWPSEGAAQEERRLACETRMARVTQAIAATWQAQDKDLDVHGEIRTPFPEGQAVPHGDVMQVFDAFVAAGLVNVDLEGAAAPVPTRDGGGWTFR
jgi:biopolymer transport protein ExbD